MEHTTLIIAHSPCGYLLLIKGLSILLYGERLISIFSKRVGQSILIFLLPLLYLL